MFGLSPIVENTLSVNAQEVNVETTTTVSDKVSVGVGSSISVLEVEGTTGDSVEISKVSIKTWVKNVLTTIGKWIVSIITKS